jgi:hypothetical protein
MAKSHPGFRAVQGDIAKRLQDKGVSAKEAHARAGAILASRTRGAGAAAKKANPRLKRVKGA